MRQGIPLLNSTSTSILVLVLLLVLVLVQVLLIIGEIMKYHGIYV